MTSHEFAQYLLKCPDLPLYVNGWGSDEGLECEVGGVAGDTRTKDQSRILYVGYYDCDKQWAVREPRISPDILSEANYESKT